MDDIRRIQRPTGTLIWRPLHMRRAADHFVTTDVPDYGLLNDLVWSDPSDTALEWEDNERGVSYCYGKAVINSFLATHVSAKHTTPNFTLIPPSIYNFITGR